MATTIVANDTFTAANGTNINARATDSGHTWTYGTGSATNASIQNNTAVDTVFSSPWLYSSYVPTTPDYDVEVVVTVDVATASAGGPIGRYDTSINRGYEAYWSGGAGAWVLSDFTGTLASFAGDIPTTPKTVRLVMVGNLIKVFIDGVQRISVTNSTYTAAGRPGIALNGGSAARTHDNWTVYEDIGFQGSTFKYWTGSLWANGKLKKWNGSAWEAAQVQRWNGSAWVNVP